MKRWEALEDKTVEALIEVTGAIDKCKLATNFVIDNRYYGNTTAISAIKEYYDKNVKFPYDSILIRVDFDNDNDIATFAMQNSLGKTSEQPWGTQDDYSFRHKWENYMAPKKQEATRPNFNTFDVTSRMTPEQEQKRLESLRAGMQRS